MKRFLSLCCSIGLLLLLGPVVNGRVDAQASAFTSIVVFGDSLSDTGNDAAVSGGKYSAAAQVPGVATGYTNGRFTDGLDTLPPARLYTGVWIEQLAAMLPSRPAVTNSLAGGTNYAYGFATTNTGTSNFTYGPGNALSFQVNNMGQQVSDYLSTSPTINNRVLFVVWGGANDLIAATSTADIVSAATRDLGLIQRLINAGGANFIVPFLPPLGLVPRYNGSATTAATVNQAAAGYNQALAAGLAQLAAANAGKSLNIYPLDTSTLFNTVVASPSTYGFANVKASSQGNTTVNPDTYLFWDDLHPTTAGHRLIALTAMRLLGTAVATSTSLASSATTVNLGANVTLTATVTNAGGSSDTPVGNVTFLDGTTPLGTGSLAGTGSTATATFSISSLTSGPHSLQAVYSGVNGFGGSSSTALSETVVPPTYSVTVSPTSQTILRGQGGAVILTITPAGGYTGTFTITCGSVPTHFSCTPQTPTVSVSGSAAVATSLSFATNVAANRIPSFLQKDNPLVLACFGMPLLGGFAFVARRRRIGSVMLTVVLAVGSLALVGLTACSDQYANDTAAGSYQVPAVVTPSTGAATTVNFTVVVQ